MAGWFLTLRWGTVLCQVLLFAAVRFLFAMPVPAMVLGLIAFEVVSNLLFVWLMRVQKRVPGPLFTGVMFIGTLRTNRALQFVFASLTVLFVLLAVARASHNEVVELIAGCEGVLCGASAIYAGLAQVLNESYGRVVLPLCPVKK